MLNSSFLDRLSNRSEEVLLVLLENMIWPILVLTLLAIAILVPQALKNVRSIELVMYSSVPLGLLVLAESLCLLSGHFDLSVGAIAGFSAMFTGLALGQCLACWSIFADPWIGFILILAVGGVVGALNGISITKLGINPFLQTLAFLIIFGGARTAMSTQPATGLPQTYLAPGGSSTFAIGTLVIIFLFFGIILKYTSFGQAVYATGSDKESARAIGINVDRIVIAVYTISGLLSGLAGLMLTGFSGVVPSGVAEGLVFPAFAAAVIGGVSLFGGRGKVTGALGGVILLGLVQSALDLSGVPVTAVPMLNGVVLLVAIILYNTKDSIRNNILAQTVTNE
jgi:ribose/xylose/arabinose/galactoside ABC-type transport system permease subunit